MSDSDYRFEVALSFAGDDKRDFVRDVATLLQLQIGSGKVFFDEWFESELAGPDAQVVLQQIYVEQTRLVVACVCGRYNEKPWTQDEWRAIQAFERTLRDAGTDNLRRMRFLPLRFGDGPIDGVYSTAIVPDVRGRTPEIVAELILERLSHTKKSPNTQLEEMLASDIGTSERATALQYSISAKQQDKITALDGPASVIGEQLHEIDRWFRRSFEYCLRRKKDPKATSNTCTYFFGLDFNEQQPVLRTDAIVQALGTELQHLDAVMWGEHHNPEKAPGKPQVADEAVDMLRFLFMLAIAVGIEDWSEIPWALWFGGPYYRARELSTVEFQSALSGLYSELLAASRNNALSKSWVTKWLERQLDALAAVVRCNGVTIQQVLVDVKDRVADPRTIPEPTRDHWRTEFPEMGTFLIYRASFSDRPGVYRELLREIAAARFDVVASASHTVVRGETAEAVLLLCTTDTDSPSREELDNRINRIKVAKQREARSSRFKGLPSDLLVVFHEIERKTFDTPGVRASEKELASAISRFRNTVRELWGAMTP